MYSGTSGSHQDQFSPHEGPATLAHAMSYIFFLIHVPS